MPGLDQTRTSQVRQTKDRRGGDAEGQKGTSQFIMNRREEYTFNGRVLEEAAGEHAFFFKDERSLTMIVTVQMKGLSHTWTPAHAHTHTHTRTRVCAHAHTHTYAIYKHLFIVT